MKPVLLAALAVAAWFFIFGCSEIPTSPRPTCITEASDGKVYYCGTDSTYNNAAVGRE